MDYPEICAMNAHRYAFPHIEVASAVFIACDMLERGRLEFYLNSKNGAIMLATEVIGNGRRMPLIEVDHLDAKALRTLDLVLFSLANPPLPMIAAYEGVVILDDPWEPARGFIDSFETKVRRASDLSSSLTALATVRDAFLTGAVAYAVDANTGRTIICVMSEDGVSPVFSVDMPKPRDMRSAPGYVALSASGGFFS